MISNVNEFLQNNDQVPNLHDNGLLVSFIRGWAERLSQRIIKAIISFSDICITSDKSAKEDILYEYKLCNKFLVCEHSDDYSKGFKHFKS